MMKGRAALVDAYLCCCTRAGGLPEQEPVTPAVRNSEILLLPSAVDVRDRLEMSNCFFQTAERDPLGHLLVFK